MHLRIRELREDLELTQEYIAKYVLFIDQSEYSNYERGARDLPIDAAVKLAVFYDVSLDYLVGLSNESTPHGRIQGLIPNPRRVTPILRDPKNPKP